MEDKFYKPNKYDIPKYVRIGFTYILVIIYFIAGYYNYLQHEFNSLLGFMWKLAVIAFVLVVLAAGITFIFIDLIFYCFSFVESIRKVITIKVSKIQQNDSKSKLSFFTYVIGFPIFAYFFLGKFCFIVIEKIEVAVYSVTKKYIYDEGYKPVFWSKLGIVPTAFYPIIFPILIVFTIFQCTILIVGYIIYKLSILFTNFAQSIIGEVEKIFNNIK